MNDIENIIDLYEGVYVGEDGVSRQARAKLTRLLALSNLDWIGLAQAANGIESLAASNPIDRQAAEIIFMDAINKCRKHDRLERLSSLVVNKDGSEGELVNALDVAHRDIEYFINGTPTGNFRNGMTESNIRTLHTLSAVRAVIAEPTHEEEK